MQDLVVSDLESHIEHVQATHLDHVLRYDVVIQGFLVLVRILDFVSGSLNRRGSPDGKSLVQECNIAH